MTTASSGSGTDTDNSGFNISGNYIANNWAEGIIYEVSYNASITDNSFVDNAWGQGPSPALGGFPDPGLYISESGSDSRVSGAYGASFASRQRLRGQLGWRGHLRELQPCLWHHQRLDVHPDRTEYLHLVVVRLNIPNGKTTRLRTTSTTVGGRRRTSR